MMKLSKVETSKDITKSIFYRYMKDDLFAINRENMNDFIINLKNAHNNLISGRSAIVQELFLLHQICKSFYEYNDDVLELSHVKFRATVLFPNLIYMLIRHFHIAHSFLKANINKIYNEIQGKSYGIIQKFINSYYLDEELLKLDVLYNYLGNGLRKFDPLIIEKTDVFYLQCFRSIFYYYLKANQKHSFQSSTNWEIEANISTFNIEPTRLKIYRDSLYELQIEKMCKESNNYRQLSKNYNLFQKIVIDNELQNMCFGPLKDNKYKFLKSQNAENNIDKLKELPIIYNLLRCIRIENPDYKPYDGKIIKPGTIKIAILEELVSSFKNLYSETDTYGILNKISENVTARILTGEYINLFTLSEIRIEDISFITQLKKFIKIIVEGGYVKE